MIRKLSSVRRSLASIRGGETLGRSNTFSSSVVSARNLVSHRTGSLNSILSPTCGLSAILPQNIPDSCRNLSSSSQFLSINESAQKVESQETRRDVKKLQLILDNLLSYESFKAAVVARAEDFSQNPSFSIPIVRDVRDILRTIPEQVPDGAGIHLLETLILPTHDITVPSDAVAMLLESFILALEQMRNSPMKMTPSDAVRSQDLLDKLKSIKIQYTREHSQEEMDGWERSLNFALNHTLDVFADAVSNTGNLDDSKSIVQAAEKILLEAGASTASTLPERLTMRPDIVSFNTVITAWSKSVLPIPHMSCPDQYKMAHRLRQIAAVNAAERSEAILKILLEVAEEMPSMKLTDVTFSSVISAWTKVEGEKANKQVFDLLLPLMDKLYNANKGPAVTALNLSMACETLACHKSAAAMQENVELILDYGRRYQISLSPLFSNAILSAYRRVDSDDFPHSKKNTMNMIDFFNSKVRTPNSLSFMLVIGAIRQTILKTMRPEQKLSQEAKSLLMRAGDLADIRMKNDVIGCCIFQPEEAERLFYAMGNDVDFNSYRYLLTAYERSSNDQNSYAEKAESVLKTMEQLSQTDHSLTPTSQEYNAVILAWLAKKDINSVHRARAVLQGLLERYQQDLENMLASGQSYRIESRPNSTSFIVIMGEYSKYGNHKHVEIVEEMLSQMRAMHIAAAQAPEEMRKRYSPVEVNTTAVNLLLNMYLKYKDIQPTFVQKAENLMKQLTRFGTGCKPDEYSYAILLKAYEGSHDAIENTFKLLDLASQNQDNNCLTLRVYNGALKNVAKCGEEGALKAEHLLLDMKSKNVMPDMYSFTAVMQGWISKSSFDGCRRAEKILQEAISAKQVDSLCFECLIDAYVKLRHPGAYERAEGVLKLMEEEARHNPAVVVTPRTLHSLFSEAPSNQVATDYFLEVVKVYDRSRHVEATRVINMTKILLRNLYNDKDSDVVAQEIVRVLRAALSLPLDEKKTAITNHQVGTVIRKLCQCEKFDEAAALLDELYANSRTRQLLCYRSYTNVIHGLAKLASTREGAAEAAKTLLDRMEESAQSGIELARPIGDTYACCIEAWAKSGLPHCDKRASEILKRMILNIPEEDPSFGKAFYLVLKACSYRVGNSPDAESALLAARTLSQAFKFGLVPHSAAYANQLILTAESGLDQDRKEAIMRELMLSCQHEGLVNDVVLRTFTRVAPKVLACSILRVEPSQLSVLQVRDLPHRWTRNQRSQMGFRETKKCKQEEK